MRSIKLLSGNIESTYSQAQGMAIPSTRSKQACLVNKETPKIQRSQVLLLNAKLFVVNVRRKEISFLSDG